MNRIRIRIKKIYIIDQKASTRIHKFQIINRFRKIILIMSFLNKKISNKKMSYNKIIWRFSDGLKMKLKLFQKKALYLKLKIKYKIIMKIVEIRQIINLKIKDKI
jgi:hypothetical protein